MKQTEIVKRAFQLTFRHPVLWVWGILVALTSAGGGGGLNYTFGRDNGAGRMPHGLGSAGIGPGGWAAIAGCACLFLLILVIVTLIIQYVSRTALYRMVNETEQTHAEPTLREGFRLGWSNRAFRLFLLEIIIALAVVIAAILLLALAASPLLFLLIKSPAARWTGIALTVGTGLLAVLILIVVAAGLSLLGQFWAREIVLADRSIGEAFACGFRLVRDRIKDAGLMWLLLFAIGIGWGLLLIPIALALLLMASGVGLAIGYTVAGVTRSMLWGVIAGLPLFIAIAAVPLTFLRGLYTVFESSAWTLAYRELTRRDVQADPAAVSVAT